ncbi:hypothetical protein QP615_14415 [Providencia rettgeri]|nr:hypothetical protein [Providencia rettgeri]MDK7744907.1 hypothetical protein [Providencia rettgeri]MDK7758779.1 hypothetical protein [Providencia rettgeri]
MFEKQFYHVKALSEVSSQLDADIPHYPPIFKGAAESPDDLQDYTTRWEWFYNHERQNMTLNSYTSMQHMQHMSWFYLLPPLKMGKLLEHNVWAV